MILSLTMTLGAMDTPVFAAGRDRCSNTQRSIHRGTCDNSGSRLRNLRRTGLFAQRQMVKTYCYKNRKQVTNKYGYQDQGESIIASSKAGVATKVSDSRGTCRYHVLINAAESLRKAFTWSSTKYSVLGKCGQAEEKARMKLPTMQPMALKMVRGDCYVMAATFCMMAKVKTGKTVYMVKGTVPQANGKNGPHGWCEVKMEQE